MALQNMDNAAQFAIDRLIPAKEQWGKVRVLYDQVTMAAALANGDVVNIGAPIPAGARFLYGIILSTATVGATATVAIGFTPTDGSAADPNAYRLAATHTVANVPDLFGHTVGIQTVLAVESQIDFTIGAANFPAGGELSIMMFFAVE
ncbi:MAG: hypothetical protein V3W44_08545 [Dehalococcoidales bacterium]